MCLSVLSCAAVARAGRSVIIRTRAQTVADSVALAWVMHGAGAARSVAHSSHSVIVDAVDNGTTLRVVIHTGGVDASVTAERAFPAATDALVDAGAGT